MNQNSEDFARDEMSRRLQACGWVIQNKKANNSVAIRDFQTSAGLTRHILFVKQKAEEQPTKYASDKSKYIINDPLPFACESTDAPTRFTDCRGLKP